MPSPAKRSAQQAFGTNDSSGTSKKKKHQRRSRKSGGKRDEPTATQEESSKPHSPTKKRRKSPVILSNDSEPSYQPDSQNGTKQDDGNLPEVQDSTLPDGSSVPSEPIQVQGEPSISPVHGAVTSDQKTRSKRKKSRAERKEQSKQKATEGETIDEQLQQQEVAAPTIDESVPATELIPNGEANIRSPSKKKHSRKSKKTGKLVIKHAEEEKTKPDTANTSVRRSRHGWHFSRPAGGVFIDHDPVLTPDEQFLILATKQGIHLYATKTSLLVRTIHIGRKSEVTAYAQTTLQEQHLLVGLKDGTLLKYDWTNGKRLWSAAFTGSINSITSTSASEQGDGILMLLEQESGASSLLSLALDRDGKTLGSRKLLAKKHIGKRVSFSASLGALVVGTNDSLFVGQLGGYDAEKEASLHWQEIPVPGKVVCFDAQISTLSAQTGKKTQPTIDIAVGLKGGEIHIYNDVLSKPSDLQPRRLHWHRTAPRTVKFSPDSNYLISGGDETVLVIWQLDTSQKQVLPHLSTAILNATVSARGSAYALRLGDNSVMMLSTSDLKPFANVTSLAFDASSDAPFLQGLTVPATLHPDHSDRLLLAYSLQSQNPSIKPSEKSSNMLQTYDVASQVQLQRQALTRNLVSTINVGPGGVPLNEPDVTHLEISHDGKWLISVDQWSPSDSDLKELYLSRGDRPGRAQLNECYLRFWTAPSSADSTDSWELNTRIDEPVSTSETLHGTREILALAVSPVRHQVAVADSNSHLKIYSPKARMRSGVPIKDGNGQQLFSWTCDYEMHFQESAAVSSPKSATLAFSEDGSVLAVSWASTSDNRARVHLLEPKSGKTAAALPGIVTSGRSNLMFSGQHLVALSSRFIIYDTITMQTTFEVDLKERYDASKSRLAVNSRSGVAAVAVVGRGTDQASDVVVFDVRSAEKRILVEEQIRSQVQVLLAERDRGGFLIIDGQGRTIKLSAPGSRSLAVALTQPPEKGVVQSNLENVFGNSKTEAASVKEESSSAVSGRALEDVFKFDTSAHVPAVKDLFSQVARVVSNMSA